MTGSPNSVVTNQKIKYKYQPLHGLLIIKFAQLVYSDFRPRGDNQEYKTF